MLTWSDEKLEKYVKDILDKEKKSEEERKQKQEEAEIATESYNNWVIEHGYD